MKKGVRVGDDYRRLGRNIRNARKTAGLTQTELGTALGVSFQQIQKYESGANRIPVLQLVEVASIVAQPLDTLVLLD